MGKVYIGQDLRLTLIGGIDITDGSAKMRYRKPGASSYTEVDVSIQAPTTATCYHDFASAANDLDTKGSWTAWLRLWDAAGKFYPCEPFLFTVYEEGS